MIKKLIKNEDITEIKSTFFLNADKWKIDGTIEKYNNPKIVNKAIIFRKFLYILPQSC